MWSSIRVIYRFFQKENTITGLGFNPTGEAMATIDRYGICLVSDVNTNTYNFHLSMGMNSEFGNIKRYSNFSNATTILLLRLVRSL